MQRNNTYGSVAFFDLEEGKEELRQRSRILSRRQPMGLGSPKPHTDKRNLLAWSAAPGEASQLQVVEEAVLTPRQYFNV